MKKILLSCAVMMLFVSCGNSGGGSKSHTPSNGIQNEQMPQESLLYSQISLAAAGFTGEYNHEIELKVNEDVDLVANFSSEDEGKQCSINVTLTSVESAKIKSLSQDLKICIYQTSSDIQIDALTNGIGLTKSNGEVEYANKDLLGQNGEAYLCKGKAAFYKAIKEILQSRLESNCPSNSISAFVNP